MFPFVPALFQDHNYNCHPKIGDHCVILVLRATLQLALIGHCSSSLKSQQIALAESHIAKKLKAAFFGKGSVKEY